MITKKILLERLAALKVYQVAMKSVGSEDRARIENTVDAIMENAAKKMGPLLERIEKDPKLKLKLQTELQKDHKANNAVVIVDGSKSGSLGD